MRVVLTHNTCLFKLLLKFLFILMSLCCFPFSAAQLSSVVCALHQAQLREGIDEVRHAHRPRAAPVLRNAGNDTDPEAGLPGAHEIRRVRGQIPGTGTQEKTAAQRHAKQVTSSLLTF